MDHTLPFNSNSTISNLGGLHHDLPFEQTSKLNNVEFLSSSNMLSAELAELSLQPLNFDNQLAISQAKEFLESVGADKSNWKIFIPQSELDEHRVFVTEFLKVDSEIIGLLAIEMINLTDDSINRAVTVNCLANLDTVEINQDVIKEYISGHLYHLSNRQEWREISIGGLSDLLELAQLKV